MNTICVVCANIMADIDVCYANVATASKLQGIARSILKIDAIHYNILTSFNKQQNRTPNKLRSMGIKALFHVMHIILKTFCLVAILSANQKLRMTSVNGTAADNGNVFRFTGINNRSSCTSAIVSSATIKNGTGKSN